VTKAKDVSVHTADGGRDRIRGSREKRNYAPATDDSVQGRTNGRSKVEEKRRLKNNWRKIEREEAGRRNKVTITTTCSGGDGKEIFDRTSPEIYSI